MGAPPDGDNGQGPTWDRQRYLIAQRSIDLLEPWSHHPSPRALRALAARPTTRSDVEASLRAGLTSGTAAREIRRAGLWAVSRVPPTVQQRWIRAAARGHRVQDIAHVEQAGASTVALVVYGPPASGGLGWRLADRAVAMWEQGLSLAEVAASAGRRAGALRAELEAMGRPLPQRWSSGDVRQALGWSSARVHQLMKGGDFPPADGVEGVQDLAWWWPATIERWAARKGLVECPGCGGRFMDVRAHQLAKASCGRPG